MDSYDKIYELSGLTEAMNIAFVDIRQLFDENGKLKDSRELNISQQAAIQSITTEQIGGKLITKTTVKFCDRIKALTLLCRNLGILKDVGGTLPGTNANVNIDGTPKATYIFRDSVKILEK